MPDTATLTDRLVAAQLRDLTGIAADARAARYTDADPLDYAVPAILLLNGAATEQHSYALLAESDARAAGAALKTTRNLVAAGIVRNAPRVERLVARHPAFVKKLGHGPLGRMPAEARTIRLVSKLLLDSTEFETLLRRGYFSWDDGSAQLALCIDFAWRHAADPSDWLTQKPRQLRFDAQAVTRRVFKEKRDHPLALAVELRYRQTWYTLTDNGRRDHERKLRSIAAAAAPDRAATALFAELSLLDLGLRTDQPRLIRDAIAGVVRRRSDLDGHRSLAAPLAWAQLFEGRLDEVASSTTKLLRSRSPAVKSQAIPLLYRLGQTGKAEKLEIQMTQVDRERSES